MILSVSPTALHYSKTALTNKKLNRICNEIANRDLINKII